MSINSDHKKIENKGYKQSNATFNQEIFVGFRNCFGVLSINPETYSKELI